MFSSHTPKPAMEGWWKCCKCDNDVDPEQYKDEICPCSHPRCDGCKDLSTQSTSDHNNIQYGMQYGHPNQYTPHYTDYDTHQDTALGYTQYTDAANMAGWWQCCQCGREVNGDWNPDQCPDCSHYRDETCYNL